MAARILPKRTWIPRKSPQSAVANDLDPLLVSIPGRDLADQLLGPWPAHTCIYGAVVNSTVEFTTKFSVQVVPRCESPARISCRRQHRCETMHEVPPSFVNILLFAQVVENMTTLPSIVLSGIIYWQKQISARNQRVRARLLLASYYQLGLCYRLHTQHSMSCSFQV
jgi:hypothetical protein